MATTATPASFLTQTDALLRKNLTFQKRNKKANCRLILFPILVCLVPFLIKWKISGKIKIPPKIVVPKACYGAEMQSSSDNECVITSPPENPAFLQIPEPAYRAVSSSSVGDFPDESCRRTENCPATILVTAKNKSLGLGLIDLFFQRYSISNSSDILDSFAEGVFGTSSPSDASMFVEKALLTESPVYNLQPQCKENSTVSVSIPLGPHRVDKEIKCLGSLSLWRNSSTEINKELYEGYWNGNPERKTNEIVAAYNLMDSNTNNNFNVRVWYNSTMKERTRDNDEIIMTRVARSMNMAANAYLNLVRGPKFKILLKFIKEMPKHAYAEPDDDILIMFAALLCTWVILQLYPVMVTSLVYEKQENLRIMMKMHGLSDSAYWMISYIYFLTISTAYMLCFVVACNVLGPKIFSPHEKSLQLVALFMYLNVQIAFAFLSAGVFSKVKTASVVSFLIVFGTGLVGKFFFENKIADTTFPRGWIAVMEMYPGFALYRLLYEFVSYTQRVRYAHTSGMKWEDLSDSGNGMTQLLILMVVQWFVILGLAFYVDQVVGTGSGVRRSPLFFLPKKPGSTSLKKDHSSALEQADKEDVAREREKVEQLLAEPNANYAIVCDNLKKSYPGEDGNPAKVAVRGLSLALPRGECFGVLGPNGAGKTSFLKMMNGLTEPSSGTAYVGGWDIRTDMNRIYTSMGVCPQHDLLWGTLTGREHLLFYGRLKNLRGSSLKRAVEDSLKSVNLFNGGVPDKAASTYSGGMKRRLSVAISLIGNPKVVYMDEPSTGLDPASRSELWGVVMRAKRDCAIILTTHSMEEAERLCDRLGIFVDGSLQCIATAQQLKARYGGFYVLTITTQPQHEKEVEAIVGRLSPGAKRTYYISGTQKFELPKNEVRILRVYSAMEEAKSEFPIQAWGLVDTTLEEVFIRVARGAQESDAI